VRTRRIGCPAVPETKFTISFMAPHGATVKEDDPVLRFDPETLRDE
jgi:hypothetical protein